MTAPLKWRSQLCPCGYCPDGTRIEWRYSIDIRFRPRRRPDGGKDVREKQTGVPASVPGIVDVLAIAGSARMRDDGRKALGGSEAGK